MLGRDVVASSMTITPGVVSRISVFCGSAPAGSDRLVLSLSTIGRFLSRSLFESYGSMVAFLM